MFPLTIDKNTPMIENVEKSQTAGFLKKESNGRIDQKEASVG